MDEMYLFKDSTHKFTLPPGKQPNRHFRIQVQKFLSSSSCAASKFPLQMFSTCFSGPWVVQVMSHNKREDCAEIWEYKVVWLYPANVQTNKAEVKRCKFITWFNSTKAVLSSIHHAVQLDPTIMVIGHPVGKGEDHAKKSIIGCADSVGILCITYQNGIGDETGLLLVLWLLMAESEAQKPSFIASWRRQRFG
jgi:hypothetical protein